MSKLVSVVAPAFPALTATAGEAAQARFMEFFTANIRNPHTRRAYAQATREFLAWCAGVLSIGAVKPVHVAHYVPFVFAANGRSYLKRLRPKAARW